MVAIDKLINEIIRINDVIVKGFSLPALRMWNLARVTWYGCYLQTRNQGGGGVEGPPPPPPLATKGPLG